jgi:hypothetical protein
MAFAVSKQGCSALLAVSAIVAGALMGSVQASVIESSPSFPPIPLSFLSPTGAGCFDIATVCVTPGIFTLTSAKSNFLLPAVQDVVADATYTGSLTPLPPATGSLGSFTLSGTVDLAVLGRTSDTETGSWTTQITSLSLSGPLLNFGTLFATLDPSRSSTGTTSIAALGNGEFQISSFFDVFMDVTLDRPSPLPPLHTTVGPIPVEAGVPEPATWAMMLVGFVGLGFLGYRKVRQGTLAATVFFRVAAFVEGRAGAGPLFRVLRGATGTSQRSRLQAAALYDRQRQCGGDFCAGRIRRTGGHGLHRGVAPHGRGKNGGGVAGIALLAAGAAGHDEAAV